jgi:hypothetical protein
MTDAAQARANLCASVALALSDAEDFMATTEAHHKAIGGDVLNPNGADQRASLSECLLSHRVVCMLRQLAEMLPAPEEPPASQNTAVDVDGELEYLEFRASRFGGVKIKDAR